MQSLKLIIRPKNNDSTIGRAEARATENITKRGGTDKTSNKM
jgi:hypothetical protein